MASSDEKRRQDRARGAITAEARFIAERLRLLRQLGAGQRQAMLPER